MHHAARVRRAALTGSLVLLALLIALVTFQRSDEPDGAPQPADAGASMVVYDGDARGAILTRGATMVGVTSTGTVRWRLRLDKRDQLPFAACLRACPEAEIAAARSGAVPPDRPDGPRRRISAPGWKPVAQSPRLRIDRPLLPAATPARVTAAATGPPRIVLAGRDVELSDLDYFTALSADRRTAVLVSRTRRARQRALVLRRRGAGWRLARRVEIGSGVQSACLAADGSRLGLVGGGPPRIVDLKLDRRPTVVRGWHDEERHAGICALGRSTVATVIVKSTASGEQTILTVHRGERRPRIVRLSGPLPLGLWASAATGATAVLQDGRLLVVTAGGVRRVWRAVAAAVAIGPSQQLVFRASGPPTTRGF